MRKKSTKTVSNDETLDDIRQLKFLIVLNKLELYKKSKNNNLIVDRRDYTKLCELERELENMEKGIKTRTNKMDTSNNSYMRSITCAKINNDNDYHKLLECAGYEKVVLDKMNQIKQHDELKESSNIFKRFIMFICDIAKGIFID